MCKVSVVDDTNLAKITFNEKRDCELIMIHQVGEGPCHGGGCVYVCVCVCVCVCYSPWS